MLDRLAGTTTVVSASGPDTADALAKERYGSDTGTALVEADTHHCPGNSIAVAAASCTSVAPGTPN